MEFLFLLSHNVYDGSDSRMEPSQNPLSGEQNPRLASRTDLLRSCCLSRRGSASMKPAGLPLTAIYVFFCNPFQKAETATSSMETMQSLQRVVRLEKARSLQREAAGCFPSPIPFGPEDAAFAYPSTPEHVPRMTLEPGGKVLQNPPFMGKSARQLARQEALPWSCCPSC